MTDAPDAAATRVSWEAFPGAVAYSVTFRPAPPVLWPERGQRVVAGKLVDWRKAKRLRRLGWPA